MANATITVLEADGATETDVIVLDVGRQAAAASKSVAASTEDKAVLDAIAASLALIDNAISAGNELQVDVVGALPAGTNNIGDVDVLTINGVAPAFGDGVKGATVLRTVLASDSPGVITPGETTSAASISVTPATDGLAPGWLARAHAANPTAVNAGAQLELAANRHGVPFVIGGHPNPVNRTYTITPGDGTQADINLLATTLSSGTIAVVTQLHVKAGKSNTNNPTVRIGFGASAVPTSSATGVNNLLMDEDFGPGEGHQIGNGSGIIAVGGDGLELRMDLATAVTGSGGFITVNVIYYTIES
jgi:hypothetical protein